jgi:hypothetical protein
MEANGGKINRSIWACCKIEEIGIEKEERAWKGRLSNLRIENEGLPFYEGKRRGK